MRIFTVNNGSIMKSFVVKINFNFIKSNAAAILSGVFLFSAISKIFYWNSTEHAIESLILNKEISAAITVSLIFVEFSISISLLFMPKLWRYIGLSSGFLIIVFTFVVFL